MSQNNFSNFASKIHSNLQMRDILFHLQERPSVNINILLFCCWSAYIGLGSLSKKNLQYLISAIFPYDQIVIALQKMVTTSNKIENESWQKNITPIISNLVLLANQMEYGILADNVLGTYACRTSRQKLIDACKNISIYIKEVGGTDEKSIEAIKQLLAYLFPDVDYTDLAAYLSDSLLKKGRSSFSYLQLPLDY